jgi:hypothetical protein
MLSFLLFYLVAIIVTANMVALWQAFTRVAIDDRAVARSALLWPLMVIAAVFMVVATAIGLIMAPLEFAYRYLKGRFTRA